MGEEEVRIYGILIGKAVVGREHGATVNAEGRAMADDDEALALDDAPPNLEAALRPRRSGRQQMARLALLGLLGLAAMVALAVIVGPRWWPSWAPRLQSGATLMISSNVSWGRVEARGAGVDFAGSLPLQVNFGGGVGTKTVTLTFTAAPFRVKTCRISLPEQAGDTCSVDKTARGQGAGGPVRITFDEGLADLPEDHAALALGAVDNYLVANEQTTAVPVGGHYTLGSGVTSRVYVADARLLGVLQTRREAIPGGCETICGGTAYTQPAPVERRLWAIRVAVQQAWQIYGLSKEGTAGATLGGVPESQGDVTLNMVAEQEAGLWSAWAVAPEGNSASATSQICLDGEVIFGNLYFEQGLDGLQTDFHVADAGVDGCLIATEYVAGGVSKPVAFLWRLGQLYAANAEAGTIAPSFPRANGVDLAAFGG